MSASLPRDDVADGATGTDGACSSVDDGQPELWDRVKALRADQAASTIDTESVDNFDVEEVREENCEDGGPHAAGS